MRSVRASIWLIVGTVISCVVLALLPSLRLSSVPTETPAKVRTVYVGRGNVRQTVHMRGHVRYEQEYAVIAPVTGIAQEVYVEPGEHVIAGQALVRMDDTAQAAAASSAYAAMAASAAQDTVSLPEEIEELLSAQSSAMDALTLRAPADGLVLDVPVGQYGGMLAGSGAVLMAGGNQMVICLAAAHDAKELRQGMYAIISTDGEPVCGARIRRVGLPKPDSLTGQTVCEVLLVPDEEIDLPYGSAVETEIMLREKIGGTIVPVTAVTEDGTVWVVSDGRCWETAVEVLLADEMHCWVSLPEGTAVVDRPEGLIKGQRVKEVSP